MFIRSVPGAARAAGAGERAAGAGATCRLFFLSARSIGMIAGSSGVAVRREGHLGAWDEDLALLASVLHETL